MRRTMKKLICGILVTIMCIGSLITVQAAEDTVSSNMPEPILAEDYGLPETDDDVIETYSIPGICNAEEWDILYWVNEIRMANDTFPLSMYSNIQSAAEVRANELITLFSHDRPDGRSCFTALEEANVPMMSMGENIAAGFPNVESVMDGWMNSVGHRSNILDEDGMGYSHIGVGYVKGGSYTDNWVQMFAGMGCSVQSINVSSMKSRAASAPDGKMEALGLILEVHCDCHDTAYLPITDAMCSGYDPSLGNDTVQHVDVYYYDVMNDHMFVTTVTVGTGMPFNDVSAQDWFVNSVRYVYNNKLMTGLNTTTFAPGQAVARSQFAVILHRMNGAPLMTYEAKFPDVAAGLWYTDAVLWANSIGVVNGYSNTGKFGTADKINREQMAVMMYRYAQYKGYDVSQKASFENYRDAVQVNVFAQEAMQWAVGTGIITGKDNGTRLDPQGNASRAECATIIMRFLEKYPG